MKVNINPNRIDFNELNQLQVMEVNYF